MHINEDFRVVYEYETRFLDKSMVPKLLNYLPNFNINFKNYANVNLIESLKIVILI